MLVNNKNNLTKDINQHIIEIYQQTNAIKDTRKERKIMLEIEKRVLKTLVKEMPGMTTYEKGYLDGVVSTAAAMSSKRQEKEIELRRKDVEVTEQIEKAG